MFRTLFFDENRADVSHLGLSKVDVNIPYCRRNRVRGSVADLVYLITAIHQLQLLVALVLGPRIVPTTAETVPGSSGPRKHRNDHGGEPSRRRGVFFPTRSGLRVSSPDTRVFLASDWPGQEPSTRVPRMEHLDQLISHR